MKPDTFFIMILKQINSFLALNPEFSITDFSKMKARREKIITNHAEAFKFIHNPTDNEIQINEMIWKL